MLLSRTTICRCCTVAAWMIETARPLSATDNVLSHMVCPIVQPHQSAEKWAAAFPHNPKPQSFGQLMNEESTYLGAVPT